MTLPPRLLGEDDPHNSIAIHFQKALQALQSEEFELAESHYRFILGTSLDQIGDSHFQLGEFGVAEQAYQQALRNVPLFEPTLIDLGYVYLYERRYQDGIHAVEQCLELAPSSASFVSRKSRNLQEIKESLPLASLQAPARLLLAKLYLAERQYEKAAVELEKAREFDPSDLDVQFTLALAYLNQQQLLRAKKVFEQMQSLLGDSALLRVRLGRAYQETDHWKEALEEFRRAIVLDPQFSQGHYQLGLTYLLLNRLKEGVAAIEQGSKQNPAHDLTYFYLGLSSAIAGNLVEAVRSLDLAITADPGNPLPYLFLGQLNYQSGAFKKAIPSLKQAVSLVSQRAKQGRSSDRIQAEFAYAAHYLYGQALVHASPSLLDEAKPHLEIAEALMKSSGGGVTRLQGLPVPDNTQLTLGTLRRVFSLTRAPLILQREIPDQKTADNLMSSGKAYRNSAARAYRSLALLDMGRRDFKVAAERLQAASRWDDSVPDLQRHLTRARLMEKEYSGTPDPKPELFLALAQIPEGLRSTQLSFLNGDYSLAERSLQPHAASQPRDPRVLGLMGTILMAEYRWKEGEAAFLQAVQLNPKQPDGFLLLSSLYRRQNRSPEASETLQKGRQVFPSQPDILLGLARLHAEQGKLTQAAGYIQEVLSSSVAANYYRVLADVQTLAGRYADAEQSYLRYLESHPESAATLHGLSRIGRRLGDPSRSVQYATRARNLAPYCSTILFESAHAHLVAGLPEHAIQLLRRLRLMEPDNPHTLFSLGQALTARLDSDEIKEAIKCYQRYVELKPEHPEGHGFLGYCAFLTKDYELAKKHLERSLELNPNQTAPYFFQGMIAYENGEDAQARELLTKVLEKAPNHGMAHLGMAKLFQRRQEYEQAVIELQKAASLLPNAKEVYYQLSLAYRQLGETEKSRQALEAYEKLRARSQEQEEK